MGRSEGSGVTGAQLHAVLCAALGIRNEQGSRAAVPEALGMSVAAYRNATAPGRGEVSVGAVLGYAARAGVELRVLPSEGPPRGVIEVRASAQVMPQVHSPTASDT